MLNGSGISSLMPFINTLGGLAIFLIGLDYMSTYLKRSAGETLKLILEKATANKFIGVLVGTLVTVLIQSSSATTSILVSFVHSQLLSFERSVAVLMGANIGTTITGQIVAFNVSKWSYLLIFVGFLLQTVATKAKNKNIGGIILGLGLLFLGLKIMSNAMAVFRDSEYFMDLIRSLENVGWVIFVGAVFTALIQSSSATIGIVIGMATQDIISIEAAMPVVLGANLGTCITAIFAALKSNISGKRVAAAHVIFNLGGILVFAFWIPQFIELIRQISPNADVARLVANGQSAFNILSTLVWFPFTGLLEKLARKCIPGESLNDIEHYSLPSPKNLSQSPTLSLLQSKDSIMHIKDLIREMFWYARLHLVSPDRDIRDEKFIHTRSEHKRIRLESLDFLSKLAKLNLDYKQTVKVLKQSSLINELEHLAIQVEATFLENKRKIPYQDETYSKLDRYYKKTLKYFNDSCKAALNESELHAEVAKAKIFLLNKQEKYLRSSLINRIHKNETIYHPEDEELTLKILDLLKSINASSLRICESISEQFTG